MGDKKDEDLENEVVKSKEMDLATVMERQYLDIKVMIDEHTNGFVFSKKKVQDDFVWHCHLCNARIQCIVFLQDHIDSEKHQQKLSVSQHHRSLFKRIEHVTGEVCEGHVDNAAKIQGTLDQYKGSPLIGLEYLVEILPLYGDEEPRYLCTLCDKRGDPRIVLGHLTSFKHHTKYLKEHFPVTYADIQAVYGNEKVPKQELQNIVSDVCLQIESSYGRLKPVIYKVDYFDTHESIIKKRIIKDPHFSEPSSGFNWHPVGVKKPVRLPPNMKPIPHAPPPANAYREMPPVRYDLQHPSYAQSHHGGANFLPPMYRYPPPNGVCREAPPMRYDVQQTNYAQPVRNEINPQPQVASMGYVGPSSSVVYEDKRAPHNVAYPAKRISPIKYPDPSYPAKGRIDSEDKGRNVQSDRSSSQKKVDASYDDIITKKLAELKKNAEEALRVRDAKIKLKQLSGHKSKSPVSSHPYPSRSQLQSRSRSRSPWSHSRSRSRRRSRSNSRSRDYHLPNDTYRSHGRSRRSRSKSRSRSRSPRRYRPRRGSRSESRSPFRDERFEDKIERELSKKYEYYDDVPEKHPKYASEWKRFWEWKCKVLLIEKKDPNKYDFTPEWAKFWGKRIKELFAEELKVMRDELKEKKSQPRNISTKEPVKVYGGRKGEIAGKSDAEIRDEASKVNKAEKNEVKKKATIKEILQVLTAMETHLGSLGPQVNSLLAEVLILEKSTPGSSETVLDNQKNVVLFEMVLEKLKGLIITGIVEGVMMTATQKAIDSLSYLLENVEKKNPTPSIVPLSSPLFPLATPTPPPPENIEVDRVAIAQQIAAALVAQGRTDVSQEELRQLINSVVAVAQSSARRQQEDKMAVKITQPPLPEAPILVKVDERPIRSEVSERPIQNEVSTKSGRDQPEMLLPDKSENMDDLSEDELKTLLENVQDLSSEERQCLLAYLNRTEKFEILQKYIDPPESVDPKSEDSDDEDSSFRAMFAAVSKKVKEREMAMGVEESYNFQQNDLHVGPQMEVLPTFQQTKGMVVNFMGPVTHQMPLEMPVQMPLEMPVQMPLEMPVQMPVQDPRLAKRLENSVQEISTIIGRCEQVPRTSREKLFRVGTPVKTCNIQIPVKNNNPS